MSKQYGMDPVGCLASMPIMEFSDRFKSVILSLSTIESELLDSLYNLTGNKKSRYEGTEPECHFQSMDEVEKRLNVVLDLANSLNELLR